MKKGQRIDFDKLAKIMQEKTDYKFRGRGKKNNIHEPNLINGETDLARKINLMEKNSPKDYLAILQGGTKPASADLKVINDLSKNYNLPNPVINAVVDYVLYKADNVLSRPYAEKVAVSLVRENILTAVDAMNYLKKVDKKSRSRKVNKTFIKVLETEHKDVSGAEDKNKDWESDWDKFLDEINGGDDGGKA
jgi:replication initiation and membrane attachment protein DnaB